MRSFIFWQDVFLSLLAEKKQVVFVLIFLTLGVGSCTTTLHMNAMMKAESQRYAAAHQLMGISLYQTDFSQKQAIFSLSKWRQLQRDLKAQQIEVMAYQSVNGLHIVGVEPDILHWLGVKLKSGRFLLKIDEGQKIAVVGSAVAPEAVLPVVGVLEPMDNVPWFDFDINQSIFIPLTTLPRLGTPLDPKSILLKVKTEQKKEIQKTVETFFKIYSEDALFFQDPQNWGFVKHQVQLFGQVIGGFSFVMLFLGGVFLVQVIHHLLAQRRHELGVRMAVGASATDCLLYMMAQIFLLTATASGIGLLLSLLITALLSVMCAWPWVLSIIGLLVHVGVIVLGLTIVFIPLLRIKNSMPGAFLI